MVYTGTQLHSVMFRGGKHSPPHFKFIGKFTNCIFWGEKLLFMPQLLSWIPGGFFANSCDELMKV